MISEAKLGILRTLRDSTGPVSFAGLVPEESLLSGMMFNGLIANANQRFDDSSDHWRITKAGLSVLQQAENRAKYPPRPVLGQKVRIKSFMIKFPGYDQNGNTDVRARWITEPFDNPREGIFIGVRTVQRGYWETDSYEDGGGSYFVVTEYVDTWLVVTHIQHNPIYVSPLDVEVL